MRSILVLAVTALLVTSPAYARGHGGPHLKTPSGGHHYVHTYVKRNGTVVHAHTSRNPSRP